MTTTTKPHVDRILREAALERTKNLTVRTEEVSGAGPWNDETKLYDDLVIEYKLAPSTDWPGRYTVYIDGVIIGWVVRIDYGEDKGLWRSFVSNKIMGWTPERQGYLIARNGRREDAIWEILYAARHAIKRLLA